MPDTSNNWTPASASQLQRFAFMKSKGKLLFLLLGYCPPQDSLRALPSACTGQCGLAGSGNRRSLTGVLSSLSDRKAKTGFEPVDAREVLERETSLPIIRWSFTNAPTSQQHIAPMGQDFHTAFNVGMEATGICTVDADGLALAAIQGLNQKLESGKQKAERPIEKLEAENAELKQRLEKMEQLVTGRTRGAK